MAQIRSCLQLLSVAALLATSWACSGSFETGKDVSDSDIGSVADTGGGANDAVDTAIADLWGLGGAVDVLAGDIDPAGATSVLLQSRGTMDCTVEAQILELATAVVPEDRVDSIFHWWTLEVLPGDEPCGWDGPTQFQIGLGTPDASLASIADRTGLSLTTSMSFWIQESEADPIWLVGVAGTQEQLDGSAEGTAVFPVEDGAYNLVTLYGIPLDTR